jgi:hypothetical protein
MLHQILEVNNVTLEILVLQPRIFMAVELLYQIVMQTHAGFIIAQSKNPRVLLLFQQDVATQLAQASPIVN